MARVRSTRSAVVLSATPAVALPLLGFLLFTSTGRDDAYITYWAARSLARTGEITNYNGDRLEQSSSLLHTVLLAGLNKVTTASIPDIGIWVGIVAATATAVLAARVAERIAPGSGLTAAALTAVSPFLVYWAFGGLDAPIVALLLLAMASAAAAAVATPGRRSLTWLAVVTVLFVTVRPEAGLALACAAGAAVLLSLSPWSPVTDVDNHTATDSAPGARPWRGAVLLLAFGVVASLLLLGWREWYFGQPAPQPVTAKVGGVEIGDGLHYVRLWWLHWWMLPLLLAAIAGVVVAARRRHWTSAMVVLLLASYGGFVVLTGGDWMEVGRFLVPLVPLVAVLTAVALREVPQALVRRLLALLVVATQVVGLLWVATDWSTGRPAWAKLTAALPAPDLARAQSSPWYERANRVHFRDLAVLGHLEQVVDALAQQRPAVTVTSGQAGMVPYYLMQSRGAHVEFIDRGSLTTDTFDRCSHALIRSSLGAAMTFDYWLAHTGECGVAAPDVVYDVGQFGAVPGLAGRYTLVYQQPATPIVPDTTHLRGRGTTAAEFVAVRNDLAHLVTQP